MAGSGRSTRVAGKEVAGVGHKSRVSGKLACLQDHTHSRNEKGASIAGITQIHVTCCDNTRIGYLLETFPQE